MECMVTHWTVIEAVVLYASLAEPASIVLGDAPLQRCDFRDLRKTAGIDLLVSRLTEHGIDVGVRDFRRTRLDPLDPHTAPERNVTPISDFVQFDLGQDSALEPITDRDRRFRVAMYDPRRLWRAHGPGRHRYLVARAAIEADTIFNLAKLKTHRKAGLTGAIKNMIGINGHKEFLPHHRIGSPVNGGDCYDRPSVIKRAGEALLDAANLLDRPSARRLLRAGARLASETDRLLGGDANLDGSWHGNDTIWRTTLDVHRIARYGRCDGSMSDLPVRRIVSAVDAIVAGEREGPLEPTPLALRLLGISGEAPAIDWSAAILMGLDPRRLPTVRESFRVARWPLTQRSPAESEFVVNGERVSDEELFLQFGRASIPPTFWSGHCELPSSSA